MRRLVAEQGACSGVVVGSWPELVEWTRRSYLVPAPNDDWQPVYSAALAAVKDAFWAESLKVAPIETAGAVERALVDLVSATDPAGGFQAPNFAGLATRPRRHLADLLRLAQALGGRLPPELESILAIACRGCARRLAHAVR